MPRFAVALARCTPGLAMKRVTVMLCWGLRIFACLVFPFAPIFWTSGRVIEILRLVVVYLLSLWYHCKAALGSVAVDQATELTLVNMAGSLADCAMHDPCSWHNHSLQTRHRLHFVCFRLTGALYVL